MAVIDFRLRPPVKGFLDMVMYAKAERRDGITRSHGMEPAASAQAKSMEMLLAEMDEAGVTCGVVMGRYSGLYGSVSNRDVADIVRAWPGRFVGVGSIDPSERRRAIAQIDEAIDLSEAVLDFFADRLKVQQREAGVRHDLIDAVFALGGEDDIVRLLQRVKALQAFVETPEGVDLLAGYKRATNILKKENWSEDGTPWHAPSFDPAPEAR